MLVTNVLTYILILVLLTVVPMLPGLVMNRVLGSGLAQEPSSRPARR